MRLPLSKAAVARAVADRVGLRCTTVLVPAGRTVFWQVATDSDAWTHLLLRHDSAADVVVPLERRPVDPPGTATALLPDWRPLQRPGRWRVDAGRVRGPARPVTWAGEDPPEDIALLRAPDPVTGWLLVPHAGSGGRMALDARPPAAWANADTLTVGPDGIALVGRLLGVEGRPVRLLVAPAGSQAAAATEPAPGTASAGDTKVIEVPLSFDGSRWAATLAVADLVLAHVPAAGTRLHVHAVMADGTRVRVGRPLSDLHNLSGVYRYPWVTDASGGHQIRPQFTGSRRLELQVRPIPDGPR